MENKRSKAEDFIKKHFNGLEKETWYPVIVAITEEYAKQERQRINVCIAAIEGALDGLEFDNTCDVVEKSVVIYQLREQINIFKK